MSLKAGRSGINNSLVDPVDGSLLGVLSTDQVNDLIKEVYADNGVLGAKNLLNKGWVTQTIAGITFTANDDGSVTVNGTSTGLAVFSTEYYFKAGDAFILNGCPSGGSDNTYRLDMNKENYGANDYGNGVKVLIPSDGTYNVRIRIPSGVTVNDLKFYPMLRFASDPDDTYAPYAMTNKELTDRKLDVSVLKSITADAADFAAFKIAIANL